MSRNFTWPVNPSSASPIEFVLDGSNTTVSQDTGTPANSKPLPVTVLGSSGSSVDPATEATLAAAKADLDALNARLPSGLVPEKYDSILITYVGATSSIDTVVYKLAGITVADLQMVYDGSSRLSTVTKS